MNVYEFTPKQLQVITMILKRGNTVEIKKVAGQIQIIEIERKVLNKTII